ncbi:MAG TPA: sigma-70 family RNA polymerase sigma factor [Nannocystaceae bacterium]|nr:sigma-70 family RNA polymerase sigma factor [Nannocystaceae bacterium]
MSRSFFDRLPIVLPSDASLLEAWRAGDRAAGEALIGRHYRTVLRFFELNASWAADDLAQRTFLACIEGADDVRDVAAFRGWLLGIARRQLARHLRQLAQSDALARFDAAPESTRMSTLVARSRDQLLVLRALASLPRSTQALLILYYWDGVRTPELAEAYAVPPSTIRTRLERARDRLRERMESLRKPGAASPIDEDTLQQLLGSVLAADALPAIGARS